ncbi:putative membrane protein YhiD involved in acid resistance [Desulfobaculum xiamenense]|uniref:Putative membrane protein YhiD involved in acid resistance n=1 Tax=Desulfobaculum xiamenense TaxID=995050 RepID=A0A846QEJ8_9BACT|nr:DUF4956 domain-containing protein [Desulfobaculum xiamenense]NJB66701.1 putative membrane protein YhiD involved in acid resistance [Desulfobaculum xiamenense]
MLDSLQDLVLVPGGITLEQILARLAASLLLGLAISYIYRLNSRSLSVEHQFGFTLVSVTMVVATVMSVIGSNITLSLGLIGALSIIRFRAVIKNTADMAYLFWAIAEGLAVGSENFTVGWVSTIVIGLVMILMTRYGAFNLSNRNFIVTFTLPRDTIGLEELKTRLGSYKDLRMELKSSHSHCRNGLCEYTFEAKGRKPESLQTMLADLEKETAIASISVLSPETNLYV